jgi:hypothetical protein
MNAAPGQSQASSHRSPLGEGPPVSVTLPLQGRSVPQRESQRVLW